MSLLHQIRTALPNPILKPVAGIDISMWEPDSVIDWSLMDERAKFVIMKATEDYFPDPEVHKHCTRLRGSKYMQGLYHFMHEDNIQTQANIFLKTAREVGAVIDREWQFPIAPILDVEVKAKMPGIHFAAQVKAWLDIVEHGTNRKPIIYTSENFWNNYVCIYSNGALIPPPWTKDYSLWVAQYPYLPFINGVTSPGKLPQGWSEYIAWQYYDAYRFSAIRYNGCDVNVMQEWYFNSLTKPAINQKKIETNNLVYTERII